MAGSIRSPLAFWIGGASSNVGGAQAGIRSLTAPWLGGASSVTAVTQAGIRSFMALWAGGAGIGSAVIPPFVLPPIAVGGSVGYVSFDTNKRARLIKQEDDEILEIIEILMASKNLWHQ